MAKNDSQIKPQEPELELETEKATVTKTSAEQTNKNATVENEKKRKPRKLSQPFFTTSIELRTIQAQRVMNRAFKPLAGSLFRSDVIFRIIQGDKAADALEVAIKELLEPVEKDLSDTIGQAQALIKKQKIKSMPNYTYPRSYKPEIKSPQIAKYIGMISNLDLLIIYLDSLWIMGAIDNKSRQHQTFDWQQRLIKLANRIIHIERQARKEADKLGITEQVEAVAPKADLDKAEQDLQKSTDDDEEDESQTESADLSTEAV